RHHVIAEILREELLRRGQLGEVLAGLILAMASRVGPGMSRSARPWRLLRLLINHEFLSKAVGIEGARNLYRAFETTLSWEYHYWLQRGSLEVKFGDLRLAENFLSRARGLQPSEPL